MLTIAIRNALFTWVQNTSGLAASKVIWAEQIGDVPSGTYITINVVGSEAVGQDANRVSDNLKTIADDDVDTVDFANDELDVAAHAYTTGDGPMQLVTSDTLPTGLELATDYWIVVIDAGTIQLADTFAKAIAAVPTPVTFSDVGVGTHTIEDTETTAAAGAEINHSALGSREVSFEIRCYVDDAAAVGQAISILELVKTKASLPTVRDALDTAGIGLGAMSSVTRFSGVVGSTVLEPRSMLDATLWLAAEESETGTYIETVQTLEDPPIT